MTNNEKNHLPSEKPFTLNMAKSRLSVGYTKNNKKFVDYWNDSNTFEKVNNKFKEMNLDEYVLLDGPPYANGPLHLGHALNKNFKDLVVKSRWYKGQPVNFRPGWDCHGLPLELAVEKKHGKKPVAELKKLCKELALTSVENHKQGFKSLGVLADWENPYLTLSKENLTGNWDTLADLFDKELLVYKQYPVHYCADCASSLASAELETKKLPKHSLYFKMKLDDPNHNAVYALVWTTTPWTLPMNQGLAYRDKSEFNAFYSQKLNEYLLLENTSVDSVKDYLELNEYELLADWTNLKGALLSSAYQPLTGEEVLLKPADFVEAGKTGFVHTAFAHGAEDFEFGVKHGKLPKTYLNKYGKFDTLEHTVFNVLNGLPREKVTDLVLNMLKENGNFVSYSSSEEEQNVCWRHKTGVFYNATWQVFLDLENPNFNLKEKVKSLLLKSQLTDYDKNQLSLMLLNREHWCLSRQRSWGCEMNLLVDKETKSLSPLSSNYLRMLSSDRHEEAKTLLDNNPHLEVFQDVLDVWFDSGNVVNTYMANNGPKSDKYVVDLALEGKDQYRGWFQAMMWLSVAKNEVLPYNNLFCHGFVLNTDKEKFSKSAGNAKSVDYYVDNFGADVLRLWVASQESGKDAVFSELKLKEMQSLYSRLRLTLRFLTSNLYDYDVKKHKDLFEKYKKQECFDLERYLLKQVTLLNEVFMTSFEKYDFKTPLESLYEFTNKTLSNFVFDWAKNPLYLRNLKTEERVKLQTFMFEVLMAMFDMVKVYAPFVAEEFYQDFFGENKTVFEEYYFSKEKVDELDNLSSNLDWGQVLLLRKELAGNLDALQKDKKLRARTEADMQVTMSKEQCLLLDNVRDNYRLRELFNVASVNYSVGDFSVKVNVLSADENYQKCPKCWNYEKNSLFANSGLCNTCEEDELS